MPIQYPQGRVTPESISDISDRSVNNALVNDSMRIQNTGNSLINEQNQTLWDDAKKKNGQKVLFDMATKTLEFIEQSGDPVGVWSKTHKDWQRNLAEIGFPTDKLPPAGASAEVIQEGLNNILNSANLGGGGRPPDTEAEMMQTVGPDGNPVYTPARDVAGKQAVPGYQAQPSRHQWEYDTVVSQYKARGEVPPDYDVWLKEDPRRQSSAAMQAYNSYLGSLPEGAAPMGEAQYAATRAGDIAGSTANSSANVSRQQGIVTQGREVADGLPVLKRTLALLDVVETGGVINEAQLAFAKTFGIETADQGELSANLGKAVLTQLRETFGAQFTKEEGDRLIAIEAGFGKNNATNRRLLSQAIAIVEMKMTRAAKISRELGDEVTAQVIEDAMKMDLTPDDSVIEYDSNGLRVN